MIASVLVCALLVAGALYFWSVQGFVRGLVLLAAYAAVSEAFCAYCRRVGGVLRYSWLARTLGSALNVRYTPESLAVLRAIDPTRQLALGVEPHGLFALAMSWALAAHGGRELPEFIARRTLVMAHAAHRLVPLVRELFATAGVISHASDSVDAALAAGWNVAFAPSGIDGWLYSHVAEPADADGTVYVRRARRQRGMFRRVHERGMLLVPVLSLKEDTAYAPLLQLGDDFNVLYAGRLLVLPICPEVPVRVGAPLDARHYPTVEALMDAYYAALRALGNETEVHIAT